METPVEVRTDEPPTPGDATWECEQSLFKSLGAGGRLFRVREASALILYTEATAKLTRFRWLGNHISLPAQRGMPRANTYQAKARLKFGDGRMAEVRHAADVTVGIAGNKAPFQPLPPTRICRDLRHWLGNRISFEVRRHSGPNGRLAL